MRVLAGELAFHALNTDFCVSDLMLLNWHYYRAALTFVLSHNAQILSVQLQQQQSYFVAKPMDFLSRAADFSPAQRSALFVLCTQARTRGEPIPTGELERHGFRPDDFRAMLGLSDEQRRWNDLTNVQLRLFDPQGQWHAIVTFANPRGEPLRLKLMYRDAEAYGYTLGLQADPDCLYEVTDTIAVSEADLLARMRLNATDFPRHLRPAVYGRVAS